MCSHREVNVDIREILPIWQACFGDSEEDIRRFFEVLGDCTESYLCREQGQAVSMVHVIPACVWDGRRVYPAAYLYAVGTLPKFRGRGYSSKLVKSVLRELTRRGIMPFLVPAGEGLVVFYERLGMELRGTEKVLTGELKEECWEWADQNGQSCQVEQKEAGGCSLAEISAREYVELRRRSLRPGEVRLAETAQEYALELWRAEGGSIGILSAGKYRSGVLYELKDGVLTLPEFPRLEAGALYRAPEGREQGLENQENREKQGLQAAMILAGALGAKQIRLHCSHYVMAAAVEGVMLPKELWFRLALD